MWAVFTDAASCFIYLLKATVHFYLRPCTHNVFEARRAEQATGGRNSGDMNVESIYRSDQLKYKKEKEAKPTQFR